MNPIANIHIFLSLTNDGDKQTRSAIASTSLIFAFLIVVVFSFASKVIFDLFGITLPAFRITGGLLVFLIGFHMLQGNLSRVNHPSEKDKQESKEEALSISVSPLAIPILPGPGTITTAMNFSAGGFVNMGVTIAVFALLCAITYLCFVLGEKFVVFMDASALGA